MFSLLFGVVALIATVLISTHHDNGGEISFWEQFSRGSDRH